MAVYKETIEVKSHGKTPTYIDSSKNSVMTIMKMEMNFYRKI